MTSQADQTPGEHFAIDKMPGHWLLAHMGKRVLRPGGLELTRQMVQALNIQPADDVVEFAPGLGATARLILARGPASYTAIERDEAAAAQVDAYLNGPHQRCLVGRAQETGLPDVCASVVYGEAILTMQMPSTKQEIVHEAARLLKSGGRYGIHELCLQPDSLPVDQKDEIRQALSQAIHVGARPLTVAEWRALLSNAGFTVTAQAVTPMRLLEPRRLLQDEGWVGALRFLANVARDPAARRRVMAMRAVFRRHAGALAAVTLVGVKPELDGRA